MLSFAFQNLTSTNSHDLADSHLPLFKQHTFTSFYLETNTLPCAHVPKISTRCFETPAFRTTQMNNVADRRAPKLDWLAILSSHFLPLNYCSNHSKQITISTSLPCHKRLSSILITSFRNTPFWWFSG